MCESSCLSAAEGLILAQLAGKTYPQVLRLAEQAALTVDPELAERRREEAQKRNARVTFFRELSGTAGVSGRDLPAASIRKSRSDTLLDPIGSHRCIPERATPPGPSRECTISCAEQPVVLNEVSLLYRGRMACGPLAADGFTSGDVPA